MRIRMQNVIIAGLMLMSMSLFSQSYSLDDAIAYALVNHNDVKRNALDRTDADWQVKEYWSTGLPQVNGNIGYQYFFKIPTTIVPAGSFGPGTPETQLQFGTSNILNAGLSATAQLFDGGFLVGLKAQKAYKELVESQLGQTERDIRVNVTKAYLNVLVLQESQQIIDGNIESIGKTKYETQALYDNGFAEQLDVDRLQLTLHNLEAEQQNLVQIIESTKILLKFQMGYPIYDNISLTDEINALEASRPVNMDAELTDWSYTDRVEFGLLDQSIGLSDIQVRAFKAQYLPTLTASIDYIQSLQTDDLFSSDNKWFPTGIAGLNLAIPIYDAKGKKSKIERARIEREELLLQRNDLQRVVDMEIKTAQIGVENARRNLKQRDESSKLAQKIYDTTLIKYKEGVGASLEVNQAEIELLSAQRNYIDALFNYLIARTDFERAIGKI